MTTVREDLEATYKAQADRLRNAGRVKIGYHESDMQHPCVFVTSGDEENWGPASTYYQRFGPFKDEDEAQAFIDRDGFVATFRDVARVWQVGHRVRYVGRSPRYTEDVEPIGTEGIIVYVNSFDYPYTIVTDNYVTLYPGRDGERIGYLLRTGSLGWERVYDGPEGKAITFRHERGIDIPGVIIGPGTNPQYASVYVSAWTMQKHGLVRENRHKNEGMRRQVLLSRINDN